MKRLWHKIFGHPPVEVYHTGDIHVFHCFGCDHDFSPCGVGVHIGGRKK